MEIVMRQNLESSDSRLIEYGHRWFRRCKWTNLTSQPFAPCKLHQFDHVVEPPVSIFKNLEILFFNNLATNCVGDLLKCCRTLNIQHFQIDPLIAQLAEASTLLYSWFKYRPLVSYFVRNRVTHPDRHEIDRMVEGNQTQYLHMNNCCRRDMRYSCSSWTRELARILEPIRHSWDWDQLQGSFGLLRALILLIFESLLYFS